MNHKFVLRLQKRISFQSLYLIIRKKSVAHSTCVLVIRLQIFQLIMIHTPLSFLQISPDIKTNYFFQKFPNAEDIELTRREKPLTVQKSAIKMHNSLIYFALYIQITNNHFLSSRARLLYLRRSYCIRRSPNKHYVYRIQPLDTTSTNSLGKFSNSEKELT